MEANGGNMSSLKMMVAAPLICLALAGCGTGTPIVAGAVDTVGVAIGGGTRSKV